jgi:very-short-patch-repair endonuclease
MGPPAINDVTTLAARQHGVVSSRQLHEIGWSPSQVRACLRSGWLAPIHRGVYALGGLPLSVRGRLFAAVLACGPGAIVSHRSAAVLWKLLEWVDQPIDISVAERHVRSRTGIRVHRIAPLHPRDRRKRHGLPVTSPELTVLDLAAIDARLAEEAWNEALLERLVSASGMAALLDRRAGHRGTAALRRLLAAGGGGFSRQEAERNLHRLIREAGLPEPGRNARVHGHELDFWWPELRLNVEMDGYRWHSTRARLNRDRERDADLVARGIRVLRFSFDQLGRPERVVARLAAAIALAGAQ